jgi:hypothetical protein
VLLERQDSAIVLQLVSRRRDACIGLRGEIEHGRLTQNKKCTFQYTLGRLIRIDLLEMDFTAPSAAQQWKEVIDRISAAIDVY